jgi:hypothetical protein
MAVSSRAWFDWGVALSQAWRLNEPTHFHTKYSKKASECAMCSVGIPTDGLKDNIYEARHLAGLKNFNAHCAQAVYLLAKPPRVDGDAVREALESEP